MSNSNAKRLQAALSSRLFRGLERTGRSELRDIGPMVYWRDSRSCTVNCPWKHLPKGETGFRRHAHIEARPPQMFVEMRITEKNFITWIREDLLTEIEEGTPQ